MIVSQGEQIVFVEVKARKTLEDAAHSLSRRQLNRMFNAAQNYLAESGAGMNAEILENAMAMGW